MSRSNPIEHTPNPATRWFEWDGANGVVRYYDKTAKKNIDMPGDFTFLVLDELSSVRGWHEPSKSGIYSNEVRDTRKDPFVVKAFKEPRPLAEGIYQQIKDRVTSKSIGGYFTANIYIAFKGNGGDLQIASLKFKGSALGAWMDFRKQHRAELYSHAVKITGYTEGVKGKITFRTPKFKLVPVADATNEVAKALDKTLQEWLNHYLSRRTTEQAEQAGHVAAQTEQTQAPPVNDGVPQTEWPELSEPLTDDDIPF